MDKREFDKTDNFKETVEYKIEIYRQPSNCPDFTAEGWEEENIFPETEVDNAYYRFNHITGGKVPVRLQKSVGNGWDTLKEYWPD